MITPDYILVNHTNLLIHTVTPKCRVMPSHESTLELWPRLTLFNRFISWHFLISSAFCVLPPGLGLPLSGPPSEGAVGTPLPHRIRTKRCSCNSWLDKECIYFCHLDIIWVNTPRWGPPPHAISQEHIHSSFVLCQRHCHVRLFRWNASKDS